MIRVVLARHVQRHCPVGEFSVAGATVGEALAGVFAQHGPLRSYILDDQGGVRKHVAIFVNGETICDRERLSDPVADGAELYIAQALSGG